MSSREEVPTEAPPAEADRLLAAVQCPLLLVAPGGMLSWANGAAARLIEPGASSLAQALEKDEAEALSTAAASGQPVRLMVRVGRGPEAPTLLAAVQPLGDGRALVTLTPPEGDATVSGLSGRATFVRRLERSMQRAQIDDRYVFGALLVDLEGLALVTSTLGWASANALLRGVARRLQDSVRPGDEVAHVAGDQFAVLVDRLASGESVLAVAGRIHAALLPPFRLDGHEAFAHAAIGVALGRSGHAMAEDVLRDAGIALTRAKSQSAGRVEIYDPAMRERAIVRLRLEGELRRGIEQGEFVMHYQPILDVRTGAPYGFEALLRWQHPARGLLAPAEFVRVAEEAGLIVPIVEGLFADACSAVRGWRERFGSVSLSMNFTQPHFRDASVVDTVLGALRESGLEADGFVVEVTETVLVTDFAPVAAALESLRQRGVRVHLDDFGTGYSSLSYLYNLPIDAIKIDRSFVSRLDSAPSAEVLVKSVVDLAASLGMRAIAEGVETRGQAARLRALGCPFVQGYLFGRPMARAAAEQWLERQTARV
jgi:diguanylate cyclase (GGDEF)-like protein